MSRLSKIERKLNAIRILSGQISKLSKEERMETGMFSDLLGDISMDSMTRIKKISDKMETKAEHAINIVTDAIDEAATARMCGTASDPRRFEDYLCEFFNIRQ